MLAVTTLDKMLLASKLGSAGRGALKLIAIEERPLSLIQAAVAGIRGRLSRRKMRGVHVHETDEINIHGDRSSVLLDGEVFSAKIGHPIRLTPAQPLSFVKLAA